MTLEQKLEIKIRDEDSQIFRDATQDDIGVGTYEDYGFMSGGGLI